MTHSARFPVSERTTSDQSFTTRSHDGDPWEYGTRSPAPPVAMRMTAPAGPTVRNGFDASAVARRTGPLCLSTMSARARTRPPERQR